MPNQLYNQFNRNGNIADQLNQFINQNRNRNPREEVNRMLQTGQISQQQLNDAWRQAQGIMGMLGNK